MNYSLGFTRKILKLLIFFIFLAPPVFSQYTPSDSVLVKTTFYRQFDHSVINDYLNSNDSLKINAALLSIAQSDDTSFVKEVIKINFKKHAEQICFALSELGPSEKASNYLMNKIKDVHIPIITKRYCVIALGYTGNKNDFDNLKSLYKKMPAELNGISIALYHFYQRKIITKDELLPILKAEMTGINTHPERLFESAFALYRSGSDSKMKNNIVELVKSELNKLNSNPDKFSIKTLSYLLGCLRELKYFPSNELIFSELLNTNYFDVKVESAKLLCYYSYRNFTTLKRYLTLLDDQNPNVARQTAESIKHLKLNNSIREKLKDFLSNKIKDSNLTENTRGELFLSYLSLYPIDFNNAIKFSQKYVKQKFVYKASAIYDSSLTALNFILSNFNKETLKNRIEILQSVLAFQNKFSHNKALVEFLLKSVSSNKPPIISISAESIDSTIISNNKDEFKNIVITQVKKYKNDPDYFESIMSLQSLSKKINPSFKLQLDDILRSSKLYSVKKLADINSKKADDELMKKNNYFTKFWENAFSYSLAEVETSKGNFTIKFLPQFAPVSVGNFCLLTKKNFYKNNAFHRVVPGFVIQCGDPTETGWGGPGYDIVSEFSYLNYKTGMVGMASAGKDTEGSQWFVTTGEFPHLNGRYTIFGEIVYGLKNVYQIDQGDKILNIKLIK